MIDANELAKSGCKYLGTPYSTMDCQKLWEKMLSDCGLHMDLGGSNSWYRYMMDHGWCGTPEECKKKFGCIPKGATLFIREEIDEDTPEKFRHDGIGDITHMGDYTGLTGEEMCRIATEAGVKNADQYNLGNGAIHSSSSKGGVRTSKFLGKTIPNGGWNRVGLFTEKIHYDGIDSSDEPGTDPEPAPAPEPEMAVVWSENGKPVNSRKGPGTSYGLSLAGKIPVDSVVQVNETKDNNKGETWSKCDYTDPKGVRWKGIWIKNEFLRTEDEPEPDPETTTYTVHVPYLTADQAEALIRHYTGAWKTAENAVG